jgi:phosphoglucosamine mutase
MMKERGAVLGGESSGHIIFHDLHTSGDGIISALQLLRAMTTAGRPLSELARIMTASPQHMINVEVRAKPPLEELEPLQLAIAEAQAVLADEGRVLVRYSGTQSYCRVMVEGPTPEVTTQLTERLAETVRSCLG